MAACPHRPDDVTRGMYHCPACGIMVVGGFPHPPVRRYRQRLRREDPYEDVTDHPERWSDDDFYDYDPQLFQDMESPPPAPDEEDSGPLPF
jgi:hypothetical protein